MALTLTRTLQLTNPLMHGADVTGAQQLLTAKGFPCKTDGVFGQETGNACVAAKTRLAYPKGKRTPTCGRFLVDALEKHAPFAPPAVTSARERYTAVLRQFYDERANWDYGQVRPIPHPGQRGRVKTDCSGGVTYAAQVAKVPDPNARGFDGLGYTGTLLESKYAKRVSLLQARPGDLIVYGPFPGHHVVAILEAGPDPLVWSHGSQGDPRIMRHSQQAAYQPAGVAVLSFLP
jgi:hypothetical protein